MTATASSPTRSRRSALRSDRRATHEPKIAATSTLTRGRQSPKTARTLTRYRDWCGRSREIVTLAGAGGSTIVLDRDACTGLDRRLLAHLAVDEPPENAQLVSRCFVQRAKRSSCACRRLTTNDLRAIPSEGLGALAGAPIPADDGDPFDAKGFGYRLAPVPGSLSIPELRWCRYGAEGEHDPEQALSVRAVIASLERYEPVLALTRRALADWEQDGAISVAVLRAEAARVLTSPIVLNRKLRSTALATIERRGLSMSEIAMRCGRVKYDAAGNASGETSWLARRLGILPEGGRRTPTPWIHSDVLALIARDGLGLSPHEVEAD